VDNYKQYITLPSTGHCNWLLDSRQALSLASQQRLLSSDMLSEGAFSDWSVSA